MTKKEKNKLGVIHEIKDVKVSSLELGQDQKENSLTTH